MPARDRSHAIDNVVVVLALITTQKDVVGHETALGPDALMTTGCPHHNGSAARASPVSPTPNAASASDTISQRQLKRRTPT